MNLNGLNAIVEMCGEWKSSTHFTFYVFHSSFPGTGWICREPRITLDGTPHLFPGTESSAAVPWATNWVSLVTSYAGGYEMTNSFTVTVGTQSEPTPTLRVSCARIQFVNDGTGEYDRPERVYTVTESSRASCCRSSSRAPSPSRRLWWSRQSGRDRPLGRMMKSIRNGYVWIYNIKNRNVPVTAGSFQREKGDWGDETGRVFYEMTID